MNKNIVINALNALNNDINNSMFLNDGEKNAMIKLVEKLTNYYHDQCNKIEEEYINYIKNKKYVNLIIVMTDYIVLINDTISGKNEPYSVVNYIFKEINYDKQSGKFKRKRLI